MMKALLIALSVFTGASSGLAQECSRPRQSVRISATGDILVHKALFETVVGQKEKFKALWSQLTPTLKSADLTVGNLEGPVAPGTVAGGINAKDPGFRYDDNVYSGTHFLFNYHPFLIDDLLASGFDLVTTANNHAMDRAAVGADRTVEQLEKRGLNFTGTRKSNSRDGFGKVISVKSFKLGVVACTEMLNGMSDKYNQVLNCGSQEVVSTIAALLREADGVIVFPHWGEEYQGKPNSGQRALARKWVAAGATAIIGNHPHVLQTTEWIQRPNGEKALVVYSLGNFVAGQAPLANRATAIAHIDLKVGAGGSLRVEQFSYTPVIRQSGSLGLSYVRSANSEEYRHIQKQLGSVNCR